MDVQQGAQKRRITHAQTGPDHNSNNMDDGCSNATNRNFAANVGIQFKTPEEYFLHEPPQPFTRAFEPTSYLHSAFATSLDASPFVIEKKNALDIVLLCGSPGSGKSTFYRKHLQPLGYERVNQDTLKTVRLATPLFGLRSPHLTDDCKRGKCLSVASTCLTEGTPVVVGELRDRAIMI